MIGQKKLLNLFKYHIDSGIFPKCCIIYGDKLFGKLTLSKEISNMLKTGICIRECKAEDLRNIVELSKKVVTPTTFIIKDIDSSMSNQNVLLKILEEQPFNCYFILTASNYSAVLDTIKSRCQSFFMTTYTKDDLTEYFYLHYGSKYCDVIDTVTSICRSPVEIDLMMTYDVKDFMEYVNLVIDNIAEVSGANALKIGDRIALKSSDKSSDKYDLGLFFSAFSEVCLSRSYDNNADKNYLSALIITHSALSEVKISVLNKSMIFDSWVLEIRKEWMQ